MGLGVVDILNHTLNQTKFSTNQIAASAGNKFRKLFSANYLLLERPDYNEVTRLVAYLRNVSSPTKPIYVAASSVILNQGLLIEAENVLYQQDKKLNILMSPDIDSRDFYPLHLLLQAQYVVIATPFQYHLWRPEEQDVVKVVVDGFAQNWEFAQDFTRLPVQFLLADGAVAKVYKRIHTTSLKTALHTLQAMQKYIGPRPGTQCDWIGVSEVPDHSIEQTLTNKKCEIKIYPNDLYKVGTRSFLYLDKLLDQARVTGQVNYQNAQCNSISLYLDTIDTRGEILKTIKFVHRPSKDPKFALSIPTKGAEHLLFKLSVNEDVNDSGNQCSLSISDFTLSAR